MATAAMTPPQGIMALPENDEATAPSPLSVDDTYDAVKTGLVQARPDAAADMDAMMAEIIPQLGELTIEQLDALITGVKFLNDNPEDYAENIRQMIAEDIIDEGDFPAEFDPEFLATLLTILIEAKRSKQGAGTGMAAQMPAPQGFAKGGIADAVRIVASQGRYGDTMLAHINPTEARMLKRAGGSGTINPQTGLREYGVLKSITKVVSAPFKAVTGAIKATFKAATGLVKKVASSPIGRIALTVGLTMIGVPPPLASMLVTKVGGGSWKDAIMAGATSYLGSASGPLGNYISQGTGALSGLQIATEAGRSALVSGAVGTGMNLLSGQKLSDAVKGGITSSIMAYGSTALQSPQAAKSVLSPDQAMQNATSVSYETPQLVAGQQFTAPEDFSGQGLRMPGAPAGAPAGAPSTGANYGLTTPSTAPSGIYDLNTPYTPPGGTSMLGGMAGSGGTQTGGAISTPGIMQGASNMGQGIMQMLPGTEGTFGKGYEQFTKGAAEVFSPGPDAARVAERTAELRASGMSAADAAKQVSVESPGIIRSYGPAVAAGIGAMGMMGGFTPGQIQESELQQRLAGEPGQDLINADPSKYLVQGLPGVRYDERGNIIGSDRINYNIEAPMGGGAPMSSVQYRTPGLMEREQQGSMYATPPGAIGGPLGVMQPYNTSSMYTNLLPPPPRRYAEGGYAENEYAENEYADGGSVGFSQMLRNFLARQQQTPASSRSSGGIFSRLLRGVVPAVTPTVAPTDVGDYPVQQYSIQTPPARNATMQDVRYRTMGVDERAGQQGIASLASGGYPRRTGQISGPGTEKSDDIPAMLSDGEFVMTAKAVRGAGKGSRRAGAKQMYALMHQLEKNASRG